MDSAEWVGCIVVPTANHVVVLIEGPTGSGKTTLAKLLNGCLTINLDHMLATLPEWCTDETLTGIWHDHPQPVEIRLHTLGERIGQHAAVFIDELMRGRPDILASRVTLIEGHVLGCGDVGTLLADRLEREGMEVWRISPAALPAPR